VLGGNQGEGHWGEQYLGGLVVQKEVLDCFIVNDALLEEEGGLEGQGDGKDVRIVLKV